LTNKKNFRLFKNRNPTNLFTHIEEEQNMNEIDQMQRNQDNDEHIHIGYEYEKQDDKLNSAIHINFDKKYNEDKKRQQNKIDEED